MDARSLSPSKPTFGLSFTRLTSTPRQADQLLAGFPKSLLTGFVGSSHVQSFPGTIGIVKARVAFIFQSLLQKAILGRSCSVKRSFKGKPVGRVDQVEKLESVPKVALEFRSNDSQVLRVGGNARAFQPPGEFCRMKDVDNLRPQISHLAIGKSRLFKGDVVKVHFGPSMSQAGDINDPGAEPIRSRFL